MLLRLLSLSVFCLSVTVVADDFKLDPAPLKIHGVMKRSPGIFFPGLDDIEKPKRSDLEALIKLQTPVKSQGRRGTCSIFSATAELESLLKIRDGKEFDFSENYLEYVVQTKMKWAPSGGSDTHWNIPGFQKHGAVMETDFPYNIYDWTEKDIPSEEKDRSEKECGHLKGTRKTACLFGQMDPKKDRFEETATKIHREFGLDSLSYDVLDTEEEIQKALDEKKPLILGVRFFYKAWNHRKMVEYGLGERDMAAWDRGEVGTPTKKDVEVGEKHPAGHSIVVVGYDNEKKVYYFKNSWGTGSFGVKSDILGAGTTDGYGSITYEYAHTYGTFHEVSF